MSFILVSLLLLHRLRRVIGSAPFYMAIGLLLIFTQIVNAVELKIIVGYQGADFYISSTVLQLAYLTALMVVYITDGTLATQRLIIGAMAALGIYFYLSHITVTQCIWPGYSISKGTSADQFNYLLQQTQRTMAASILAQALDLFMIPIFYQRLRNIKCSILISVTGALMLTQIVDSIVYLTASYWGQPQWWTFMNSSYVAKGIATIWLSFIATVYILKIEEELPGETKGTLDIIFAFFGSYGKAKALQQDLREWEGRYRVVVENASEMILLLDMDGKILDINVAALRIFGINSRRKIIGRNFCDMIYDMNGTLVEWALYHKLFRIEDTQQGPHIERLEAFVIADGRKVYLDIAVSSSYFEGISVFIVLGRDVTEEKRLMHEKDELSEKLAHTQRLESIGKLAGGIAHDFNNYIHAIQGHIDLIMLMHDIKDESVMRHLEKVNEITGMAAHLTQQLLGFARKGQYVKKMININDLIKKSADLFMPKSKQGIIDFFVETNDKDVWVKGDPVQLQQVIINLLLNARDAVDSSNKNEKYIYLKADDSECFDVRLNPPDNIRIKQNKYCCICVEDSGTGIDNNIVDRIFEPFFTTKPTGKGTGMGLAMAYGTISNHQGWIQLETQKGSGSAFYIFLPKVSPEQPQN